MSFGNKRRRLFELKLQEVYIYIYHKSNSSTKVIYILKTFVEKL